LSLVHPGTAGNPFVASFLVELLARTALRPVGAGSLPAARRRRLSAHRGLRPRTRLAGASPVLVHRARRDLLGPLGRRAALLGTRLDVLVLARALRTLSNSSRRHDVTPCSTDAFRLVTYLVHAPSKRRAAREIRRSGA